MTSSYTPKPARQSPVKPLGAATQFKHIANFSKFWEQTQSVEHEFDWQFYLDYYADLQYLVSYQEAYEHWILFGRVENRQPNLKALIEYLQSQKLELPTDFDPEGYWVLNSDLRVRLAGKYRDCKATEHFLQYGRAEDRAYRSEFDWEFYLEFYDDLAELTSYAEAYDHWLTVGCAEGRYISYEAMKPSLEQRSLELPSDFNSKTYLALNPDLQARFGSSKYQMEQTIEHFLKHGKNEGRYYEYTRYQEQLPNQSALLSRLLSPTTHSQDLSIVLTQADAYECWIKHNTPNAEGLRRMQIACRCFKYQPLISIVVPTYNTPEQFLREAIESVIGQVYPFWELCIADDASTHPVVRKTIEAYMEKDCRIKAVFRTENGHISAASNSALSLATGEFVAFLDHDDVLSLDALYEIALFLNQYPEADMIYSDEDKLDAQGKRSEPYFKPDWCPDSFLSRMYTCHLGVYRQSLLKQISGFRLGFEGSQDYDLVLRITEQTGRIYHLPKILYHWRLHEDSVTSGAQAKPYAYSAAKKAIEEALYRRGEAGIVLDVPNFMGHYQVRYEISESKLVSIIIPTRDMGQLLDLCLESIFAKSTYLNYEVIVIDNGSVEPQTFQIFEKWLYQQPRRFKCYTYDISFNYSSLNNYGVQQAKGDYLLFLNNDTEVITPNWIEAMVEQAQRPSIGAVGALLLYPDNTIQHAGVVVGLGGIAGHGHQYFPADTAGYVGQVISTSNMSAVTGACLMCRREAFQAVGGFDEVLAVAYNDIDFCLKLVRAGYQNLYLPHAKLYHYESKSRGYEDTVEKQYRWRKEAALFMQRWQDFIEHDPCYSLNLTRTTSNYSIKNTGIRIDILQADLEANSALLGFALDSPKLSTTLDASHFLIAGWLVGKHSPVTYILVEYKSTLLHIIEVNQDRSDIAQIYPNIAHARTSGFNSKVELVCNNCNEQELILKAVFEDQNQIRLGSLKLKINSTSSDMFNGRVILS